MRNLVVDRICCARAAYRISAAAFLAFIALALFGGAALASAQEEAKPVAAPPPSAPSPGKALVYIYRTYRLTGSSSHDHLFLNGVYWAYLKNSEYAWMEADPGSVSVTGSTESYYAGGIAVASYTAVKNSTKKENERIRFDVEAGKTYYLKWTAAPLGLGAKVEMMDEGKAAKEISKLKLSDPVKQPDDAQKPDDAKPEGANKEKGK
jgi:hypothetical protein